MDDIAGIEAEKLGLIGNFMHRFVTEPVHRTMRSQQKKFVACYHIVLSTCFVPLKSSILPNHLEEHELIAGNAWVQASTFVAILIGTLMGKFVLNDQGVWVGGRLMVLMKIHLNRV